jgi:lysophospholipase L1-like esterase
MTEGNDFLAKFMNNDKQTMINYGVSGATVQKIANKPMMLTTEFELASNATPDIVVIMLGTNDSLYHKKGVHDL